MKEYTPAHTKAIKEKREREREIGEIPSNLLFLNGRQKKKRASLIPLTMFVMADVLAQSVKV